MTVVGFAFVSAFRQSSTRLSRRLYGPHALCAWRHLLQSALVAPPLLPSDLPLPHAPRLPHPPTPRPSPFSPAVIFMTLAGSKWPRIVGAGRGKLCSQHARPCLLPHAAHSGGHRARASPVLSSWGPASPEAGRSHTVGARPQETSARNPTLKSAIRSLKT